MNITASAVSLNVPDERASAEFLKEHFGFAEEMAADGFVALGRPDAGFNVVFLRLGLATFKPVAFASLLLWWWVGKTFAGQEEARTERGHSIQLSLRQMVIMTIVTTGVTIWVLLWAMGVWGSARQEMLWPVGYVGAAGGAVLSIRGWSSIARMLRSRGRESAE